MTPMRELTDVELDAVSGGGTEIQVTTGTGRPVTKDLRQDLTQAERATLNLDIPVTFTPI
jgi:hypothetical protein